MITILIIITYIMLILNFNAETIVSNTPNSILIIEHTLVLIICYKLITYKIKSKHAQKVFLILFYISYSLSLLLLATLWTPYLVKEFTTEWEAFDPIKYYSMAAVAIKKGLFVEGFDFFPVAYIYWAIMAIFGLNPLLPLFVNEIIFVYTVIILSNYINKNTQHKIKYYCWLLIIPELIYYNITSSKDIICMYCATIIFVKSNELLENKFTINKILSVIIFILIFFISRFSLALVSILGIILTYLYFKKFTLRKIITLITIGLTTIFILSKNLEFGNYVDTSKLIEKISSEVAGDMSVAAELHDVDENGFSQKIIPSNTFEFITFGFIRSACYLIIDGRFLHDPLPIFTFTQNNPLLSTVDITTFLMFISCLLIFKRRNYIIKDNSIKKLLFIFLIYWYIVGTFNPLMIHIRYRLVYDLFFFSIAIRAAIYKKDTSIIEKVNNENK